MCDSLIFNGMKKKSNEPISNHFRSWCQMITGSKTQAWGLLSWTYWKFDNKRRWFIFPEFNGNGAFWSAQCMKVQTQRANNHNNNKPMVQRSRSKIDDHRADMEQNCTVTMVDAPCSAEANKLQHSLQIKFPPPQPPRPKCPAKRQI